MIRAIRSARFADAYRLTPSVQSVTPCNRSYGRSAHHGEKDKGEADHGASRAGAIEEDDSQDAPHVDGIGVRGLRHRCRAEHRLG